MFTINKQLFYIKNYKKILEMWLDPKREIFITMLFCLVVIKSFFNHCLQLKLYMGKCWVFWMICCWWWMICCCWLFLMNDWMFQTKRNVCTWLCNIWVLGWGASRCFWLVAVIEYFQKPNDLNKVIRYFLICWLGIILVVI